LQGYTHFPRLTQGPDKSGLSPALALGYDVLALQAKRYSPSTKIPPRVRSILACFIVIFALECGIHAYRKERAEQDWVASKKTKLAEAGSFSFGR
jgi:hypothetical protein